MYHGRFRGTHYEIGFQWGKQLLQRGKQLDSCPTFDLTQERRTFARQCKEEYEKYFPEVLEEIQGIADGNKVPVETLHTLLMSMYCFSFDNKCTCFAFRNDKEIIFGRNSDFLVSLEKLYMNCIYRPSQGYHFNGNTTAFVQIEDGVNVWGLAIGLTFVYPHIRKPGFNAGMLVRYLLEKCRTTEEAIKALHRLPIASAQTLTLADKDGKLAVVECNPVQVVVIKPEPGESFVVSANNFYADSMRQYRNPPIDDWRSEDRYHTAVEALKNNRDNDAISLAQDILAGKYGFMCQYDRKKNADTVWSVVYDLSKKQIYRVEGNPGRKKFFLDKRFSFL